MKVSIDYPASLPFGIGYLASVQQGVLDAWEKQTPSVREQFESITIESMWLDETRANQFCISIKLAGNIQTANGLQSWSIEKKFVTKDYKKESGYRKAKQDAFEKTTETITRMIDSVQHV